MQDQRFERSAGAVARRTRWPGIRPQWVRRVAVAGAVSWLLAHPLGAAAQPAIPLVPDLAREQRMAAEIVDAILDGEALQLETADGQGFLGIYTRSAAATVKGTVIVLHGRGFHPDWPDVVQPLRVGLPSHAWNTLSIQLPVLGKGAKYFDYLGIFDAAAPRIEAAIDTARRMSGGRVVILAHSCGAHMAQHWIRQRGGVAAGGFDAFIGIGMGATDYGQPMRGPFALDRLEVPVLDLYAEDDFPAVRAQAPARLAAMRGAGHAKSVQRVVPGADHYFRDHAAALLEAVAAWLDTL